jgi:hypothetical protein
MGGGAGSGAGLGGAGGLTNVPMCMGQTPENGESCSDEELVCQTSEGLCACYDAGDGPMWYCLDTGGGGFGNFGGFGNVGSGGRGSGGRSSAGAGNMGGRG